MLKEIRQRGDIVLFIDELHTLVGAGAAEGAIDAASILKPMLARGELQTIGATTLAEYRKHLEKDAALERRFQPIMVEEPSVTDTIEILKGNRELYEQHHRVVITDEGIVAAANLADRYITDRFLPDKAIDLIDESGSRMRLTQAVASRRSCKELDDRISLLDGRARRCRRAAGLRARAGAQEPDPDDHQGAPREGRGVARRRRRVLRRHRRGGDRRGPRRVDGHPGPPPDRRGEREAAAHGGGAAQVLRVARGSRQGRLACDPSHARGPEGPEAAVRLVHLPRTVRCREDEAGEAARRLPVRRRGRADPDRHVGVHGEAHRVPARRLASGLRRLRGGRTAHRSGAASSVLGRALRRDREGALRRVQRPAADPRGRAPDRRAGSPGRLQEHRDHHDVQPRDGRRRRRPRASASRCTATTRCRTSA